MAQQIRQHTNYFIVELENFPEGCCDEETL